MIFKKDSGKNYIFSKDVYLGSDERVEKLTESQIEEFDGMNVKVAHSYLGYINDTQILSN